jgi:hypothetical protein
MNEYVASTTPCPGVLFVRVVEARVPESLLDSSFLKQTEHITIESESVNNNLNPVPSSQSHKGAKRISLASLQFTKFRRKRKPSGTEDITRKFALGTSCVLEFDGVEMEVPLHSFIRQPVVSSTHNHPEHKLWNKDLAPTRSNSNSDDPVFDEHDDDKSPSVRQEQDRLNHQPAAESPESFKQGIQPSTTNTSYRNLARKEKYSSCCSSVASPPPPPPRVVTFRPSQMHVDQREHEVVFDVQEYFGSARLTAQLQRRRGRRKSQTWHQHHHRRHHFFWKNWKHGKVCIYVTFLLDCGSADLYLPSVCCGRYVAIRY